MPREKIANFLTAERKISPLTACTLLIVAGVMAGSFQLVAPIPQDQMYTANSQNPNNQVMTAAVSATTNIDNEAPKDCAAAIQSALGQKESPKATSKSTGGSGTVDACFGAVLKPGKSPSQDKNDYTCVGRSGTVTITSARTDSVTVPYPSVPPGKCQVKVCQPYIGSDGKIVPNCSDPQQLQSGGAMVPPPIPAGAPPAPTSGPIPATPQTPTPNTPKPDPATEMVQVQPLEDVKPPAPNTPNAADQIGRIGGPIDPNAPLPATTGFGPVPGTNGAAVPSGPAAGLQPSSFPADGAPPVPGLNNPNSGYDPNAQFQPPAQQQTTFPNGQPLNAQTYPVTPPASAGFTATNNPNLWQYGAAPFNTYNQPNVNLPTLENSTMTNWSQDAMANPTAFANLGRTTTSWNDVPTSVMPPVQDLNNGINTPITCTEAGCTAKPTTPADAQALQNNGYTCANGSCTRPSGATNVPPPGTNVPPPGTNVPPPGTQTSSYTPPPSQFPPSQSGSGSNGLMSLLAGMMKGFAGAMGASQAQQQTGPAQTCPTDPQQYAQYQQQYNQQLQQYNYQLQQYNYQMQNSYSNSYYSSYPVPPTPPRPCQQGTGTNGQCPTMPAQPPTSQCPNGTWRQMTSVQTADGRTTNLVCPVWQCVSQTDTTPTAQLSCNPSVAEKGSPISISYSCTNSKTSTGYGFSTNGQTSGSTSTVIIDPPENAAGINYALKCENGSLSAGAQCSVQLTKVSISLRAEPQPTPVGKSALIGWVTTGMESCVVSSPDQPDFTARNANSKKTSGIATTSPITETSDFYLTCKTVTGATKEEKVTVQAYRPGTVTASIENRNNVQHGTSANIQWSFPDAPDVSAVALWIYSVEEQKTVALITGHRAKTGSYTWDIPNIDDPCNTSSSFVCGSDLIPGRQYEILATLYTPPSAGLGEFGSANQGLPQPKFLDNPETKTFQFSQ